MKYLLLGSLHTFSDEWVEFSTGGIFHGDSLSWVVSFQGINFSRTFYTGEICRNSYRRFFFVLFSLCLFNFTREDDKGKCPG